MTRQRTDEWDEGLNGLDNEEGWKQVRTRLG